jgi:hypothetical protein
MNPGFFSNKDSNYGYNMNANQQANILPQSSSIVSAGSNLSRSARINNGGETMNLRLPNKYVPTYGTYAEFFGQKVPRTVGPEWNVLAQPGGRFYSVGSPFYRFNSPGAAFGKKRKARKGMEFGKKRKTQNKKGSYSMSGDDDLSAYAEAAGITFFGKKRKAKKYGKAKGPDGKIVIRLPNNKGFGPKLKGYNTDGRGATVSVKVNNTIYRSRLAREDKKKKPLGPGKFRALINKKVYVFKSKGPGTFVTLMRKNKSTKFGSSCKGSAYGMEFGRKRKVSKKVVKIPKKILKMCKKLKIKVSVKRGSKRVYKKLSVLKKQIKRKLKMIKKKQR